MIGVCKVVIIFRHRVPNLRRVGVSRLFHTQLFDYVVVFIRAIMKKAEICFLNMDRQAICSRIFWLVRDL